MSPAKRWALIAAGVLCGLVLVTKRWLSRIPSLEGGISGCEMVYQQGCQVLKGTPLRVYLSAGSKTQFAVLQGGHGLRFSKQSVPARGKEPGGVRLEFHPSNSTKPVTVLAWEGSFFGWLSPGFYRIPLYDPPLPSWLLEGKSLWDKGHAQEAATLLLENLRELQRQGNKRTQTRAQAEWILAWIFEAHPKLGDRAHYNREAILSAREAGVPFAEISRTVNEARELAEKHGRYAEAEGLLLKLEPLLAQVPQWRPWYAINLGRVNEVRGDLKGALAAVEEGLLWAERLGEKQAFISLSSKRSNCLRSLGRLKDAEAAFQLQNPDPSLPCHHPSVLKSQGAGRLRILQALGPQNAGDPFPLLKKALDLYQSQCTQPAQIAEVQTLLSLEALLRAKVDFQGAAQWLHLARTSLAQAKASPDGNTAMLLHDLDGRLALLRGDDGAALVAYQALLARSPLDRLHEMRWAALIGKARARELQDPKAALKDYEEAQRYLNNRTPEISLAQGGGTLLGFFEEGSRRHLDLLFRLGQKEAALELARRTRIRGLLWVSLLSRLFDLEKSQRALFETELTRYQKARKALDDVITRKELASQRELPALEKEQKDLEQSLLERVETALGSIAGGHLPESGQLFRELAPPAKGEVLLSCHQGVGRFLCFARDQAETIAVDVGTIDPQATRVYLSQQILAPLWSKLNRAQRIRILPYGIVRDIDFHMLPIPHQGGNQPPQGDRLLYQDKEVVYALDIPDEQTHPSENKEALLLLDPEDKTGKGNELAERLGAALTKESYALSLHKGGSSSSLGIQSLRSSLSVVDLFLYYGIGRFHPDGGWHHGIATGPDAGLLVSDILLLDRVPRAVLLFGCYTGASKEEGGGVEGLGVAQAFLLRGSSIVLGATRKIGIQLAADAANAMFSRPSGVKNQLLPAYRDMLDALLLTQKVPLAPSGNGAQDVEQDLGSFRVFVL